MRKTSQRRIAKSSTPRPVPRATLYSKKSKKYVPLEDEVFAYGRRVPSFPLEEANERGLVTQQQLMEKMKLYHRSSVSHWLEIHGIRPVARIRQPKYGRQMAFAPYLYDFSEVIEMWKKNPIRPYTRKKKEQEDE